MLHPLKETPVNYDPVPLHPLIPTDMFIGRSQTQLLSLTEMYKGPGFEDINISLKKNFFFIC